jgi:thioredoxin-dependent peroxiredoxin
LAEQYEEFRAAGAEVVVVTRDSADAVNAHFQEHNIPFPCLLDPEQQAYGLFEVDTRLLSLGQRPGLFVIDVQGVISYAYIGRQQWEIPSNAQVLEVCSVIPCEAAA